MTEAIIGFVGVLLGSVITTFKEVWTFRTTRHQEGTYAALRIICLLDEYTDSCYEIANDDGTLQGRPSGRTDEGQEYYSPTTVTPKPPVYPDDIVWRSLPLELMQKILVLPNKAKSVDRHIFAASEHAFAPDYDELFHARQLGYAQLGLDALEISKSLRAHYGIETKIRANLGIEWSPEGFLRSKIAELEEKAKRESALDN